MVPHRLIAALPLALVLAAAPAPARAEPPRAPAWAHLDAFDREPADPRAFLDRRSLDLIDDTEAEITALLARVERGELAEDEAQRAARERVVQAARALGETLADEPTRALAAWTLLARQAIRVRDGATASALFRRAIDEIERAAPPEPLRAAMEEGLLLLASRLALARRDAPAIPWLRVIAGSARQQPYVRAYAYAALGVIEEDRARSFLYFELAYLNAWEGGTPMVAYFAAMQAVGRAPGGEIADLWALRLWQAATASDQPDAVAGHASVAAHWILTSPNVAFRGPFPEPPIQGVAALEDRMRDDPLRGAVGAASFALCGAKAGWTRTPPAYMDAAEAMLRAAWPDLSEDERAEYDEIFRLARRVVDASAAGEPLPKVGVTLGLEVQLTHPPFEGPPSVWHIFDLRLDQGDGRGINGAIELAAR